MHINAINTLEVRFIEEPDVFFERRLQVCRARFEAEVGCLGFAIHRSSSEPFGWLLTGYWASSEQMTAHFCSDTMSELVSTLVGLRANLGFASFTKILSETSSDVR